MFSTRIQILLVWRWVKTKISGVLKYSFCPLMVRKNHRNDSFLHLFSWMLSYPIEITNLYKNPIYCLLAQVLLKSNMEL